MGAVCCSPLLGELEGAVKPQIFWGFFIIKRIFLFRDIFLTEPIIQVVISY